MKIIGLAGPSCSGKTTIARIVARHLDAPLIHADQFGVTDPVRPIVAGFPSYERPDQYDMQAVLAHIQAMDAPIICVEGFHILGHAALCHAINHRYFVDVPFDECLRRREARAASATYDGVWTEGVRHDIEAGFAAHGASEWAAFGEPQRHTPECTILDGQQDPQVNAQYILDRITG